MAKETDPVLAAAVALGAVTEPRRGELCALRWSDVDWERRRIRIERSLTVVQRSWSPAPTKTHQRRDVAIDEAAEEFLLQRREQQERYAKEVGVAIVADPFVLSRLLGSAVFGTKLHLRSAPRADDHMNVAADAGKVPD